MKGAPFLQRGGTIFAPPVTHGEPALCVTEGERFHALVGNVPTRRHIGEKAISVIQECKPWCTNVRKRLCVCQKMPAKSCLTVWVTDKRQRV